MAHKSVIRYTYLRIERRSIEKISLEVVNTLWDIGLLTRCT
jgi:hypothetical protein